MVLEYHYIVQPSKTCVFLMMQLTHSYLNPKFDMSVTFIANYFFIGRRHSRQRRDALNDRLRESQN
jgi:hypothetical protein